MSEQASNRKERVEGLIQLFSGIRKGENLGELVKENELLINRCVPSDIVFLVDELMLMNIPMHEMKKGINKLLNLLYKTISEYPSERSGKKTFLWYLEENNRLLDEKLQQLKPWIKEINKDPDNLETRDRLISGFREIEKFTLMYQVKENILFPLIEKFIPEYRCLQVMWSFHDDIRRNLKRMNSELVQDKTDLQALNRLSGDIFFNMYAIKFREERILYPFIREVIPANELDILTREIMETGLPYFQPVRVDAGSGELSSEGNKCDLGTGNITVEQIALIFNHLPVDITYVDEHNKVRYFSTPGKRIFPRAKAVIGRDVRNCHPPESVHVVEEIVETFRSGKKDSASFWINFKGEKIHIRYFAVRDAEERYRGVIEVAQEISEIQGLKGEKRLLDWSDNPD